MAEFSKRSHGAAMAKLNERLSPSQIRANKCAKSHSRNVNRQAEARVEAEARNEAYSKLSLADKRSRNSKRVHKKLATKG